MHCTMMPNWFGLIILQLTFALQLKVVFSALGKLLLLLPNLVSMILGCLFAAIHKFFFKKKSELSASNNLDAAKVK